MITDANTGVPEAALAYVRAGFAIIPLHGVGEDGGCTCEDWTARRNAAHGPGGKQAGKHPMRKQWTQGAALGTADVHSIWMEESPRANVGIRTGVISGFWVLDVDPEAGGLESLAKLVEHTGPLDTYTVATGGDGLHFWWACPDFPVTNGSNREIKRLFGPGLDIRGDGGQVVAPPSRSGKGDYRVVRPGTINQPPAKLRELLAASLSTAVTQQVATHVVEDLPFAADLDEAERARVENYARKVIKAEADTYRNAVPGTGNETLFTSACSMLEIAQSPWNLVTSQEVYQALDAARIMRNATHPYRGGQDELEFAKTWASAQSRVVGQGRPLPAPLDAGLEFDPSPFSQAPAGPGLPSGYLTAPSSPGGTTTPSSAGITQAFSPDLFGVPAAPAISGPASAAPSTAASILSSTGPLTVLDQLRARSLDLDELAELKPPTPLIEGVLDEQTTAVLSGQFGTFKTFIALDWLLCIATGVPWMGHEVPAARPVCLVVGEGISGLYSRVKAWEKGRGVTVPKGMFKAVRGAVQLGRDEEIVALGELARERGDAAIAFDTLATCSNGLKENESDDMKRVHAAAAYLREAAGATTLLLHHAGHGGERARGSSVLEDNADTSWFVSLTGDSRHHSKPRKMTHRKTKDSELTGDIYVRFEQDEKREAGGTGSGWLQPSDAKGNVVTMVAGVPFTSPGPQVGVAALGRDEFELNTSAATVRQVFLDVFFEGEGGTRADVIKIAMRDYGLSDRSARRGWNRLVERKFVLKVRGTANFKLLTDKERELLLSDDLL